jgi:hypothetical protein
MIAEMVAHVASRVVRPWTGLGREIRARGMITHIGRANRVYFAPERDCGTDAEERARPLVR